MSKMIPVVDTALLKRGDIVRHRSSADSMVVIANYGGHAIAVRHSHISNPSEWLILNEEPSNEG